MSRTRGHAIVVGAGIAGLSTAWAAGRLGEEGDLAPTQDLSPIGGTL